MSTWQLTTPVAMLIYRRPHTTQKVLDALRQIKPSHLLVVANAPHPDKPEQVELCAATRAILEQVDWDCEVLKNYADHYLSCKDRIYSGLDWVFSQVDRAIILEDDCIPHPTFWRYCEELLDRYQHDERIVAISGDNFQQENLPRRLQPPDASYYFSRYTHFWGWASWRRAWQHYDVAMQSWAEVKDTQWLQSVLDDETAIAWWHHTFDQTYTNKVDTWDWQWIFSAWLRQGLTVVPNVNLVSNIGFGDGTHTTITQDWRANLPTHPMTFPLKHPDAIARDQQADKFEQKAYYQFLTTQNTLEQRVKRKLRQARTFLSGTRG